MRRTSVHPRQAAIDVGLGPRCGDCPALAVCPAATTSWACQTGRQRSKQGGLNAWHRDHPDVPYLLEAVSGPSFEAIRARAVPALTLPRFAAQVRVRRDLRGRLRGSCYAVSAYTAIGTRNRVLTARELRDVVGLGAEIPIVLQLFGKDGVLERLWLEREDLIPQIVDAGYLMITAPSYSTWMPRPPMEHIINHKRSLVILDELSRAGAHAVPRVAFAFPGDVRRHSRWFQGNPGAEMVALDLGTYRGERAWKEQLVFLQEFDQLTDQHLHYWIHGPSTPVRFAALAEAVTLERITLSNAKAVAGSADFAEVEEESRRQIFELAIRRDGSPSSDRPINRSAAESSKELFESRSAATLRKIDSRSRAVMG